jgi:hypothetical protein
MAASGAGWMAFTVTAGNVIAMSTMLALQDAPAFHASEVEIAGLADLTRYAHRRRAMIASEPRKRDRIRLKSGVLFS